MKSSYCMVNMLPKVIEEGHVTYITIVLVSIKSPSSQLTGAFRLYLSQGATAVVHGCSVRALDPNAE